jgi:hypothetical protein
MRRRGPPQCGQVRTSRANTRRRSSAHVERDERERAEVLGRVGELGAETACKWAAAPDPVVLRVNSRAAVRWRVAVRLARRAE